MPTERTDSMMGRRWTRQLELLLAIGLPLLAVLLYAIAYVARLITSSN
jgi:hypothetical protein